MDDRYKPPKSYIKRFRSEYSRRHYGYSDYKIEPYVFEKILASGYGIMAYISSKVGADWVFALLGLEEIDAHPGFKYVFQGPNGAGRKTIEKHNLRIFRMHKRGEPDTPQEAIDVSKRVIFSEGWKVPEDRVVSMGLSVLRLWLQSEQGHEWAQQRYRSFYYTTKQGGLTYRAESQDGTTYWLSDSEVSAEVLDLETCDSCQELFPCTDSYTGLGTLCNRCYSENFGDSEQLATCNRHECENHSCQNFIRDEALAGVADKVGDPPIKWRNYAS